MTTSSALVLLDLSAAFKTVEFGISGSALKCFAEYLCLHFFKVCRNNQYSFEHELSFSFPQGSINGPMLFNLYSSTMRKVIDQEITVNTFCR